MLSHDQIQILLQNSTPPTTPSPPITPDVYSISIIEPRLIAPSAGGVVIPLELQRYTFNQDEHRYRPIFENGAIFQLRVEHFYLKNDSCRTFPYLMDGFPVDITPQFHRICYPDPIAKRFSTMSRLVFRYSADRNLGCLVHLGFDLMPIDGDDSHIPLWITAFNQLAEDNARPSSLLA